MELTEVVAAPGELRNGHLHVKSEGTFSRNFLQVQRIECSIYVNFWNLPRQRVQRVVLRKESSRIPDFCQNHVGKLIRIHTKEEVDLYIRKCMCHAEVFMISKFLVFFLSQIVMSMYDFE